jgi:hypothetical protein
VSSEQPHLAPSDRPPAAAQDIFLINMLLFRSSKIALTAVALLLVLGSRPNGRLRSVVAAADTADFAPSDLLPSTDDAIAGVQRRRRHLELVKRLLQDSTNSSSSTACQTETTTAQNCLDANVGDANSTAGTECLTCYYDKQAQALDDFRKNPNFECGALNDNLCTPVSECTCLEPCDNEVSAMSNCLFQTAFVEVNGFELNCTISCMGTNVSLADDDYLVNSTDDFVGGLCVSEESGVKLCLESMGSTVDECFACIGTTTPVNVTTSTTCADLQVATCDWIDTCSCVKDCKTEMVALLNCDIDFSILDFPQLGNCDQLEQCPNSGGGGGTSGASSSFGGSAWARFAVVSLALGKAVAAAAALY